MIVRTKPYRQQAGITTLGMIILVSFVGIFVFAGLRLTPVYLNYFKIASVVEGVREEFDGQGAGAAAIRNSIKRRFEIDDVTVIKARDIKVTAADGGFEVSATYQHTVPFMANISFTVDFDKRELVRR